MKNLEFEVRRQVFHIVFGGLLLAVALLIGKEKTLVFYTTALLAGLFILHLKLSGFRVPLVDWILSRFERKTAAFPGQGALMYFAGSLFTFAFTPFAFALAILAIVAFGDGFATLVGMKGRYVLPWNSRKTLEGLIAFVLTSTAMAALVLPLQTAAFYALVLGIAETVDFRSDDNLLLPIVAVSVYHVLGAR